MKELKQLRQQTQILINYVGKCPGGTSKDGMNKDTPCIQKTYCITSETPFIQRQLLEGVDKPIMHCTSCGSKITLIPEPATKKIGYDENQNEILEPIRKVIFFEER